MGRTLGSNVGATVLNQDIYEISATQKHRLGTRVVRGDRVFRYAKAGMAFTSNAYPCWAPQNQTISASSVQAAAPAGQNFVLVTVGSNEGLANNGVFAKDDLAGGSILIALTNAYGELFNFVIQGNDALASAGTLKIYLDGELPVALTTSSYVEAHASLYADTRVGNGGGFVMFLGLPMRLATVAAPYYWIQTWGPVWFGSQPAVGEGWHAQECIFRDEGSLGLRTDAAAPGGTAYTINAQTAGVVMCHAQNNTQGAPFLFLQVAP